MKKAIDIKEIYFEGYAKTGSFKDDFRLGKVLQVVKRVILKNPRRMLDVGCGDGAFSIELGKSLKAQEVFGIDISPNAVQEALARHIMATALDLDEGDLPFVADFFDFIFCGNLIELVLDPDHLLEELHRVLSPGGHLVISFPNLCAWASRLAVLLGFHPYYDLVSRRFDVGKLGLPVTEYKYKSKGFVRLYTLRSFRQLAQAYGFKISECHGVRGSSLPGIIAFIDKILSQIPQFAFQVVCVAQKYKR